MSDSLQVWDKITPEFDGKYNIIKVTDDTNCMQMVLSNNDFEERCIMLDYTNCRVFSYRSYDESCWVPPFYSYVKTYGDHFLTKHTFFEVLESKYIKQIKEWGFCLELKPDELFHLMVIAGDSIFEIISHGEPNISSYDAVV